MAGNIFEKTVRPLLSPEKFGPELWTSPTFSTAWTDNFDDTYTANAEGFGLLQQAGCETGKKYRMEWVVVDSPFINEFTYCLIVIGGAGFNHVEEEEGRYTTDIIAIQDTYAGFLFVGAGWLGTIGYISLKEVL